MPSPLQLPLQSVGRDPRLDFFRGVALICMFIDHVHGSPLASFTLKRFSFIDSAEVFVFISGYVSGMVYANAYARAGIRACLSKASHRCIKLYGAHLAVFLASCVVLYAFAIHGTHLAGRGSSLYFFMDHPFQAAGAALALLHAPGFSGLLPLYIVLIGVTPLLVYMLLTRPVCGIICSLTLYLAAQVSPGLYVCVLYPSREPWNFNPAVWQLVFFAGLLLGTRRMRGDPLPPFLGRTWLVVLSVTGLVAIAFLRCVTSPTLAEFLPIDFVRDLAQVIPDRFPLTGKANLQPLRLVNLFLLVVVAGSLRRTHWFWNTPGAQPIVRLGANSLAVYCVSVVTSYAAIGLAIGWGSQTAAFVWLTVCGIGVLLLTARLSDLLKPFLRHKRRTVETSMEGSKRKPMEIGAGAVPDAHAVSKSSVRGWL